MDEPMWPNKLSLGLYIVAKVYRSNIGHTRLLQEVSGPGDISEYTDEDHRNWWDALSQLSEGMFDG